MSKPLSPEQIASDLKQHREWLVTDGAEGERLNWSRADLTDANLTGANLTRADLRDANLTGANLTGADLTRADLWGANLTVANLTRADLWGANLTVANLTRADLWGAAGIVELGQPNNWRAVAIDQGDDPMRIKVGCHWFTLAEGRAYWTGKPDRREIMAALDYAEAVAKIRGWRVE